MRYRPCVEGLSLLAGFLQFASAALQPESFRLGDRLESDRVSFSDREFLGRKSHPQVDLSRHDWFGCHCILGHPVSRRSVAFVIPAILVGGRCPIFPSGLPPMLPALVCKDWIVTVPAGLGGIGGMEPNMMVSRGIIVPEIVVLITREQEEMVHHQSEVDGH